MFRLHRRWTKSITSHLDHETTYKQGCGVEVGVVETESEGILGEVGVGRNF
jgi:hypothetical protein